MGDELRYLQALDFEISLGCPFAGLHDGICPVSDPRRWDHLDTSQPLNDVQILNACHIAYHRLGFRGWVLWHYFNDPLDGLDRLKHLIPQIKALVPEARFGLFTNGARLPKDLSRLLIFDQIWLRNYLGRDFSAVQAAHPAVLIDPAPVLDARMSTPPRLNNQRRCRRMWDEMVFDYYGHGHICTGDWRGEVTIGNLYTVPFETIVANYLAVRAAISQQPMAPNAPAFCQNCALTMRDGNCIIDPAIFAEVTQHRGF